MADEDRESEADDEGYDPPNVRAPGHERSMFWTGLSSDGTIL